MAPVDELQDSWPRRSYAWYVTALLTLAYTFSFVDRQVLNLLVIPIRTDLQLSDTQISFLQGLAFVAPYILLSIPIGRWVDLTGRKKVLILGVVFWSLSCVACGLARVPWQLAVARMGVGAGEAAVTPAAWSLFADYFRPSERALPISVFLMGPYLGGGLALILGGQLVAWARELGEINLPLIGVLTPWQFAFVVVGLPGLLLAVLLLTIAEPVRQGNVGRDNTVRMPMRDVLVNIRANWPLYSAFFIGVPFLVIVLYAMQAWVPTLLVRVHELDIAVSGRRYGVIALFAGSLGVLSGPAAARWLQGRGHKDAPLRLGVIATCLLLPCVVLAPLQRDTNTALALLTGASFFVTLPMALFAAALQSVTPNKMRGFVAGLYVFAVSGLGFAVGPTSVALITDYAFHDPMAVGRSLAIVCGLAGLIGMCVLIRAMPAYRAVA
jgi:MFS family permease